LRTSKKDSEENEYERFLEWASKNNKRYSRMSDMEKRHEIWKKEDDYIRKVNEEADATDNVDALRLRHSPLSDRTPEERKNFFGRRPASEDDKRKLSAEQTETGEHGDRR